MCSIQLKSLLPVFTGLIKSPILKNKILWHFKLQEQSRTTGKPRIEPLYLTFIKQGTERHLHKGDSTPA